MSATEFFPPGVKDLKSFFFFFLQRKTLLALEKEDEEERNKTIESLKTALRTQPMRSLISSHLISSHCSSL